MDSYSKKEFESMQQAAIRRVKEMQKRAQSYVTIPPEDSKANENVSTKNTKTALQNNRNRQNNYNQGRNISSNNHSNFNNQKSNPSQNKSNNNNPQMHRGMNTNRQQMSMGNPFSQLFGSNLGGFAKFKNMLNPFGPSHSNNSNCEESDKPLNGLLNGVLKDFDIDEEKIILGILVYLLYKNGSDAKLLLALGYLIL